MLIKKPLAPGEIATFRLITGEEVVAKIAEKTSTGYKLSKPLVVVPGERGFGLVQAMATVSPDDDLEIQDAHIVMMGSTVEPMQKHYAKMTSTIIQP